MRVGCDGNFVYEEKFRSEHWLLAADSAGQSSPDNVEHFRSRTGIVAVRRGRGEGGEISDRNVAVDIK